ncbi:MAG: hypothetical protein GY775_05240, partial [Candidatus Scalindua sp.]|nr:hypothetical protein [Candidatus Scalindua sp.]
MIRDFSVKPASYGQALSGLGQTLADYRQERDARDAQKKKERSEEIFQLSYGVYQQPPEQRRQALAQIAYSARMNEDQ